MKKEKVLIVGGGFAGVKSALELGKDNRFAVTLLSDIDHFRYYPTLYQAATGGKKANAIIPLSELFANSPVTIARGTAVTLDRKAKTIITDNDEVYGFDTLIIALGVVTNYFGIPGLAQYSYGIKSAEEVERFKQHLHARLTDERKPDMNYVIVGGGPTGIELAGALPGYLKQLMKAHGIRHRSVHIDLVEAAPRLLPRSPKSVSRVVKRRLKHLGVRVHVGKVVQGQTAGKLMVSGKPIQSHTVVWTAGVTNHPFFSDNNFVIMPRGKVATDVYLQAEDNIFVLGDNANTPYSGLAQTAVRDGVLVARNLRRRMDGKSFKPYNPKLPWSVIPAGPHWSTAQKGKFRTHGKLGWLLNQAAHFVGFRDYRPLAAASLQWLGTFDREESCRICAINLAD